MGRFGACKCWIDFDGFVHDVMGLYNMIPYERKSDSNSNLNSCREQIPIYGI
jgi:hypothetical protein